ncbi:MAG: PQQ-dependent sugar dehydrogenase [Candidatus Thermoplasmatota archaeon]
MLRVAAFAALLLILVAGCASPDSGPITAGTTPAPPSSGQTEQLPTIALETVLSGLNKPIALVENDGALYIAEQGGKVLRWTRSGTPTTSLDLTAQAQCCGEQGLLGIAFDPEDDDTLFVHYSSKPKGDTMLSRIRDGRETPVLTVAQPYGNHNGGWLAFGPDGYLYMALGDGGSGGDPQGNGQNLESLLGKILRLDIHVACIQVVGAVCPGYLSPADNPFAGTAGRDEIWAYGLRNPWRNAFDRTTGDLWIADVGQNKWEEVSFQPAASSGGENYGWDRFEGNHAFEGSASGDGMVFPILEYSNDGDECAVTGGYVYRGNAIPALRGAYLYGDYCSGNLWGFRDGVSTLLLETGLNISSFGEDAAGELYVLHHGGSLHQVVAA